MKIRDVIRRLTGDGWLELEASGRTRHFGHPARRALVTVAGRLEADVPPRTLRRMLRQTGID